MGSTFVVIVPYAHGNKRERYLFLFLLCARVRDIGDKTFSSMKSMEGF